MAELHTFPTPELTPEFTRYASAKSVNQLKTWASLLNFCAPGVKKQVLTAMQAAYFLGRNDQLDSQLQINADLIRTLKEMQ